MNILEYLPNNQCQLIGFIFWVICHSLVEFWLGRTDKVQAGSLLELIINLFKGEKNGN